MMKPRCYDHKHRDELPKLCHVCQRIAVEQDIVTRAVDAFLAAGFALQTNQSGGPWVPERPATDRDLILAELMQVDDEHMAVIKAGADPMASGQHTCEGWVRFVYGNDGYDVISDYTTNLEAILEPVNAYAETLS